MTPGSILFRPTCSNCGKVIPMVIECDTDLKQICEYTTLETTISPARCPFCFTPFSSIEMPTALPFDNSIKMTLR